MSNETLFIPVPGYDGRYIINPYGQVKRAAHERLYSNGKLVKYKEKKIPTYKDGRSGYPVVKLTKPNGKYGSQYVHRLVALAFLPKPAHKNFVNHKNGDKMDSFYENLEWVTATENYKHAVLHTLIKFPPHNTVKVKNQCTGEVYSSMFQAAKKLKVPYDAVKRKVRGLRSNVPCIEKL